MTLEPEQLAELSSYAVDAALAAGDVLANTRPRSIATKEGGGASEASQVVTEVDRRCEQVILEILAPTLGLFDLAVLSEERPDDRARLEAPYFWCIDPLDGTLAYIESSPGYSVSVGLVSRDGTPLVGVVFDPTAKRLYQAVAGQGVRIDGNAWSPPAAAPGAALSVYMDRSFAMAADRVDIERELERICAQMGLAGSELQIGRAAVTNACAALVGPPGCYFKFPKPHDGGGSLWDFAATACLFAEAGASVSDIHGDPLDLNRADSTFMNHRGVLFATDESLAAQIVAMHAGAGSEG